LNENSEIENTNNMSEYIILIIMRMRNMPKFKNSKLHIEESMERVETLVKTEQRKEV